MESVVKLSMGKRPGGYYEVDNNRRGTVLTGVEWAEYEALVNKEVLTRAEERRLRSLAYKASTETEDTAMEQPVSYGEMFETNVDEIESILDLMEA